MEKLNLKPNNFWGIAFFILLGIIIIFGAVIFIKITSIPKGEEPIETAVVEAVEEGEPSFLVEMTKEQLNRLIQSYLEKYQNSGEMNYEFLLEDEAVLRGTLEILGFQVNYYLYFEPGVLENGNVILKAKSISLGSLSLPVSMVMELLANNIKIPSWISINPSEEAVVLYLEQFTLKNGIHFKAKKIDLQEDSIQVDVYMPDIF